MAQFPKYFAKLSKDSKAQRLAQYGSLEHWTPTWQPPPELVEEAKAEKSRLEKGIATEMQIEPAPSVLKSMAKPLARPRESDESAATAQSSFSSSTVQAAPATSRRRTSSPAGAG